MNDFRIYQGMDFSGFLVHYGVGHLQGGHSGRFPWGSGENGGGATRSARDRYKTAKTNYKTAKRALRKAENRYDDVSENNLSTSSDKRTAQRDVNRRSRALDAAEVEFRKEKARLKEARANQREERRQNREAEKAARREEKDNAASKDERKHFLLNKRLNAMEDSLENVSNKQIGKLSDKELNDRINRLRQEDTYRQLIGQKTLGQLRREQDASKEMAKDTMKSLVQGTLRDLVSKVIIPTATGHVLYTLAQNKVNKENAAIKEYNLKNPNDQKKLIADVDYVSTVFKDIRQKAQENKTELPFTMKTAERILNGIKAGKGTPDDIRDFNTLLNQIQNIERLSKGGGGKKN